MNPTQPVSTPIVKDEIDTNELLQDSPLPNDLDKTKKIPQKKMLVISGVTLSLLLVTGIIFAKTQQNKVLLSSPSPSPTATPLPTLTPSPTAIATPTPIKKVANPSPKIMPSPSITPSPTSSTTPTPSPVSQDSGAPQFEINFPQENQSVSLQSGSSQRICVVETAIGGDRGGLQKKNNINNEGWTTYAGDDTVCFTPKDGQNTFSIQYRNDKGQESSVYNRQFSFQGQ